MPERDIDASPASDDQRKRAQALSLGILEAEALRRTRSIEYIRKLSRTQEVIRLFVLFVAAIVPLVLLATMFLELWGVTRFLHGLGDAPKAVFISVSVLGFVVIYAILLRMVFTPPEHGKEAPDLKAFRQPPPNIDGN